MDNYDETIKLENSPELKANPISKLFNIWLISLLRKGTKKDLNVCDVYSCLPEDESERLGDFCEREWNKEIQRSTSNSKPPRLWRVVWALIWKRYCFIGIVCCLDELGLRVLQPIFLKNFIKSFTHPPSPTPIYTRQDQYLLATGLILTSLLHAICFQKIVTACLHLGLKVRLGISSLMYRKILILQKTSNSEDLNVGKLCNLLGSDVTRFDNAFTFLHFLYISPIQVAVYSYLLWQELGPSSMGGIGCVLFLLPIQMLVGRFAIYFRTRIARRTDERGRFLNEIIRGIRLIKMYAWEVPFLSIVSKLRRNEILYIRRSLYLRGMYMCLHSIASKLNPFCALIVYFSFGNEISAEKVFFTVSIFGILRAVLNRIPNGASQFGEMIASINRIEYFLLSKNERKRELVAEDLSGKEEFVEPAIIMNNYSGSWSEERFTLRNLSVDVKGNKLVMVVAHVGAGKSSFLNAILSELPIISETGSCNVEGRLSYAAQEAWIFPGSVRQNILFGLEMDEERYRRTVELCCLMDDLDQFPDGDFTLVGERGVALSGGQKARINLARALYQEADIYLLDDPLSAVDTKVSRLLFHRLIVEHLQGKLRILVTHQLQYLPVADHIIVLNREGEVWCQGTYTELRNSNVDFTSLINEEYMRENGTGESEMRSDYDATVNEMDFDNIDNESITEVSEMTNSESSCESRSVTPDCLEKLVEDKAELPPEIPMIPKQKAETKESGSVGIKTYFRYFKSGGSYLIMILLLFSFLIAHAFNICLDYWLSIWTNSVATTPNDEVRNGTLDIVQNGSDSKDPQNFYAYVYCGLMGALVVSTIFRSFLFFRYSMRISINLHRKMVSSVLHARTKFFDDNPSGRIMNRFTRDLNHVDEHLPLAFYDFADILLLLLGMLIINIAANYYVAIPAVLLLLGTWRLRQFYLSSARDLKRLDSLTKSPMFTHVTMTVQGLTTIRALRAEKRVSSQFEKIQDIHTSVFYALLITSRWFALWLEMMSCLFLTCVCFGFLLLSTSTQSGSVGVALSSIIGLAGNLQWGIRQSAEVENYMTSVERAYEYCNLKPEEEAQSQPENFEDTKSEWPSEGRIDFKLVSLAYDDQCENKVLKDITFCTGPKQKIGIVGRTAAGKSSIVSALFRLTEVCGGDILIDNLRIQDIPLGKLRSSISIIPQDPVLFTGSLRYNLDPFDEFEDNDIWRVLKEVDLHHKIQSLDCPVSDGGGNFSTGQKQLVCLARAALRNNKILVLDEATANVDPATDNLVQTTIRTKFSDCTILTIAHRLQTVLDNDRILVLDRGRVMEFDSPEALMQKGGIFHRMLMQSNYKTE